MKPTQHSGPCAYGVQRSSNTRTEKKLHHVSTVTKLECAQMIEDPAYRKKLMADLRARRLRPAVECMLWYYAKGKPKEMVEHSGVLSMQQELAQLTPQELRGRALEIASLLAHGGNTKTG